MAKNIPWNSRITWYYYFDRHMSDYTQEDFDKEAAEMASLGIDIVLLSSKAHFRINYYPYWDRINETLRKIVIAFHKVGIKVVEHHSCSLVHVPLTKEEWEVKKNKACRLTDQGKYAAEWEQVKDWMLSDAHIDGVRVSSFMQISGATGQLVESPYDSHAVCFNNEDYRRIYFKYLESIYALGVDGIMTDDVQYYANNNSCACATCRRLFKEQTGYTMPDTTDEWNNRFFGNFDDPRYIAFDQFRRNSTIRYQRDVDAHFRSLGLNLLRPNYISNEVLSNHTAYPFSNCADLWDVMFQENVASTIIRYSWPRYACEAVHRYAFSSYNDIPSMSMFYNRCSSDMYFTFALALSWGQLWNPSFTRTPDLVETERAIRKFEKQYPYLVYDQKKKSDVACFFSIKNRDLIKNAAFNSMNGLVAWLQSAMFTQKTPNFVLEDQSLADWQKHKVIVLPQVFMMSDGELQRARDYVSSGGTLVVVDLCGKKTPEGLDRTPEEIRTLLGCKTRFRPIEEFIAKVELGDQTLDEMTYCLAYENTEPIATVGDYCVMARECMGKGEILFIGAKTNLIPFQNVIPFNRDGSSPLFGTALIQSYSVDYMRNTIGKILDYAVDNPHISRISEDYLLNMFESADANHTIAHVVNIGETLSKEKDVRVSMEDPVPDFEMREKTKGNKPIKLAFSCEYAPKAVRILSPEWMMAGQSAEKSIEFSYVNGTVSLQIPEDTFTGYLMVDAIKE